MNYFWNWGSEHRKTMLLLDLIPDLTHFFAPLHDQHMEEWIDAKCVVQENVKWTDRNSLLEPSDSETNYLIKWRVLCHWKRSSRDLNRSVKLVNYLYYFSYYYDLQDNFLLIFLLDTQYRKLQNMTTFQRWVLHLVTSCACMMFASDSSVLSSWVDVWRNMTSGPLLAWEVQQSTQKIWLIVLFKNEHC